MATDMEKARVTELHVRMDCNGCVQKIKKAMHSIDGVYDVYVDLRKQKLTVIGRADPETLVKAIKKTRKVATICSHTEPGASEPPPSEAEATSCNPPAGHAADQPPSEAPPAETTPPTDPPKDAPPQKNPAPDQEAKPSAEAQGGNPRKSKEVEEVHMAHHYPHGHVTREHWNDYPPMGHQIQHEAPYYVTQSYNSTYRPSPYVSVHGYLQSPPQDMRYHAVEASGDGYYQKEGYYQNRGSDGNQITSMFSDENPNACRMV